MPAGGLLRRLLNAPMRAGRVEWLCLRPARLVPVQMQDELLLSPQEGVVGDHYQGGGGRQISLISREDLVAIASFLAAPVTPAQLRRNVLTSGINLRALKERRFRIGDAVLAYSGECHPCSRMEAELGPGGYNAVRGHGGILARVAVGGRVRNGDAIERLPPELEEG